MTKYTCTACIGTGENNEEDDCHICQGTGKMDEAGETQYLKEESERIYGKD